MISTMIAAALLSGPANGVQVDVGHINQKTLPRLVAVERALPTSSMVTNVERILSSGECRLQGQSATKFDITVPYAVLIEPGGTSHRVVVQESGCEALESYVGLIVLQMAKAGDFAKSGGAKTRWYASEINFNLQ